MKKLLLIFVLVLVCFIATAQVSKTINVTTAGTLSTLLTATEKSTVTNLKLTGSIDRRDFETLRDVMPLLSVLDISSADIKAYSYYAANELPSYAFSKIVGSKYSGKTTLTNVLLPTNLSSIGEYAFYGCSGLVTMSIPTSVTKIGGAAFCLCAGLTSINIPNGILSIEHGVFNSCSNLSLITIPEGVKSIGDYAFIGCYKIKFLSLNPPTLSNSSFGYNIIYVPKGKIELYKTAWGTSTNYLIIEEDLDITVNVLEPGKISSTIINQINAHPGTVNKLTVTGTINDADILYISNNMKQCYEVNLENANITGLPYEAFAGRILLFEVKLPKNLTSISYGAFKDCKNLKKMDVPLNVTSIGHYAFRYCDKLKSISMPSVTTIGQQAFYYCFSLTELTFGSSINNISTEAFSNCINISSITSLSLKPATLGTNVFGGINPETCKLRILKEADFDAYFNAPQWG